ncbi:MAG: restriction endonuclease subunit R, partial [Chloroflexota bacterium]
KLEQIAKDYEYTTGVYIRPICLIQAERTGAKQRGTKYVHAEEVREFLIDKCNVLPEEIAVKSSERDEIEDEELLDRESQIRYIITKSALQEGWDCPFAYILTVLTDTEASTGMTQLVGRILRQPYARKTNIPELDESHVYCFRAKSSKLLDTIRAGFDREGLGDLVNRIVEEGGASSAMVELPIRPKFAQYAGKVYLPCFVVSDGKGGWREIGYEMDVLSRIDWAKIDTGRWAEQEPLNISQTQDSVVRVGITEATIEPLRTAAAYDMPLDLAFITHQLGDDVPNPWYAYDYVRDAINKFRERHYTDDEIRRDLGSVVERLKRFIHAERDRLAKQAFRDLIEKSELRFLLISGCAGNAIPDRIKIKAGGRKLRTPADDLPAKSLFDYPADEFNDDERDFALGLDGQDWIFGWLRNAVKSGYGVQGWKQHRVYADFIAFDAHPSIVYVLEMKGIHLKNEDTDYKQELFQLCTEQSQPTPWDEVAKALSLHRVQFEVVFGDEWQKILNEMAQTDSDD